MRECADPSDNYRFELDARRRTSLGRIGRPEHSRYLATEYPNGDVLLRPAVVLGCEPTDAVWREEIFGPVVCIRPFDEEAAMLREVNDSPYGLSGSIWTNDLKRALRVVRRIESGVLSVNSHSSVHVEAPFGGFKQSGIGRDLGMNALEGYTELKNIFISED